MADDNANNNGNSESGYGRPPQHKRFKKGQSGNPNGRPRGRLNKKTLLEKELNKRVWVVENGKRKRVRKGQVIITTLVNKAATGHNPSIAQLEAMQADHGGAAAAEMELMKAPLSEDHKRVLQEILERYFASRMTEIGGKK